MTIGDAAALSAPSADQVLPRRRRRFVGVVVAVLLAAGLGVGAATVVQRVELGDAVLLDGNGSMGGSFWSDPVDAAEEFLVPDIAGGEPTRAAPLRPGSGQGVIFPVTNDSEFPVTVLGSPAPWIFHVQVSDRPLDGMPDPASQQYLNTVVLAPGEYRYLKVTLSDEQRCVLYQKGGGLGLTGIRVDVKAGGTTRTVTVDAAVPLLFISQSDSLPADCPPENS